MEDTRHNCKFFLLRYVPDSVKSEFVNIGLVLLPAQAPPELRFTKDWSRVECLNPDVDAEFLDAFRQELMRDIATQNDRDAVLKIIEESFSNSLQASDYKACVTGSPAREADELARIYLETPRRRVGREKSARQAILQAMQREFERERVWDRMRKSIPVSQYTQAGDPLEIDCGYQLDSTVKMFHGTSLRVNVNVAKVIAFSYPALAAGIRRAHSAEARLTAVVEDGLERSEQVAFALGALEQVGIQVATVSQLPDLATTAARELGIG